MADHMRGDPQDHNKGILTAGGALPDDLPREWLLFRLSSLGDVVLCTGLLRDLNERCGWKFVVLTRPAFAPVFERNPFVSGLILPEAGQLKFPGSVGFFRQVAEQHQGWGLLDLHRNLRSHLLRFFWRGPVRRYPKFTSERRRFLRARDQELASFLRSRPVTQRYALAVLDEPPASLELLPEVYLTGEEKAAAALRIAAISAQGLAPRAALHPFATHPRKAWPREYWLDLIKRLDAEGVSWVIVGQGDALAPDDPRDLTGRTSLRELMAILGEVDLLITGDSGPMHLASAVGTPVLAMFGPTTAEWGFFPAGEDDTVLELPLGCRPCSLHGASGSGESKSCDGRCLSGIKPGVVLAEALRALGRLPIKAAPTCGGDAFDAGYKYE